MRVLIAFALVACTAVLAADITDLKLCKTFELLDIPTGPTTCLTTRTWPVVPVGDEICPNVIHMNRIELMDGNPKGPYFSIDSSAQKCRWTLNGPLSCKLKVYQDKQMTTLIGSATLSSQNFGVNLNVGGTNDINEAGGTIVFDMQLNSSALDQNLYPFVDFRNPYNFPAVLDNFYSQSVVATFEAGPMGIHPMLPATPIFNRVIHNTVVDQLQLWLWGGDCYDPEYYPEGMEQMHSPPMPGGFQTPCRKTGIDWAARLRCDDNSVVTPCAGCGVTGIQNKVVGPNCVKQQTGVASTNTYCVSLEFDSTSNNSC